MSVEITGVPGITSTASTESSINESSLKSDPSGGGASSLVEKHNQEMQKQIEAKQTEEENNNEKIAEEEIEVLESKSDPKRWTIGKPPEQGGVDTQYMHVWQRPLGFMDRSRFYALIGKTLSSAIRASGGNFGGMEEVFGQGDGTIIERGKRLREHDFKDASSFFALAMELVGYNHEFLSDFYIIALGLSVDRDRGWVRDRLNERHDPKNDQWGLSDEMALEVVEIFIDQNYEEMRSFFAEKLPLVAKRVVQIEKARAKKTEEKSQPSK